MTTEGTHGLKTNDFEQYHQGCECNNPVCTHGTSDEERADHLLHWAVILKNVGFPDIRLVPLWEHSQGPRIPKGDTIEDAELVTPEEAAQRIREDGVRGFYLYADMADHGTEGLIFTDEDMPEQWPDLNDTLRAVSGSGEGEQGYWINDGWNRGANWKGDDNLDVGGVKVNRTGVVVPGSIHRDCDGIYHVINDSPPAPLSPGDVPPELQPAGSGSLPSDETSHSPPESVDEDAVERVREAIREFYKDMHGSAWNGVSKRARDMLTDLMRGRYRSPEPGMNRDVVRRFETLDDDGDDRECRHEAENCLSGLLYGIIKRHTRADKDEAEDLVYHYMSHLCEKKPKTTEGRQRKWHLSEAYRRNTIRGAIEGFDREWFRRWRRKQYDDGPTFTGEYSEVTYKTVMGAIIDLSGDVGEFPTQYQYPTRKEITFLCHQRDGRSERTYKTALSRLVNQHGEVKRAEMGNDSIYYLTWREDPEDATEIHPDPPRTFESVHWVRQNPKPRLVVVYGGLHRLSGFGGWYKKPPPVNYREPRSPR